MSVAPAPDPATVFELVERQAAARPGAPYVVALDGSTAVTFSDLRESCRRIGASLAARGLAPRDTISVVMPNGVQTVRMLVGAMHAGYCVNPVNLLSQAEQMRYVLDHSDCRLVVTSPEWEARVRAALSTVERAVDVAVLDPNGFEAELAALLPVSGESMSPSPLSPPSADAIALLMYTSGTTGVPKGVMLGQGNLAANALAISREHALGAGDRVLAVLPLYHINAFAVTMLAPLDHGGSLVLVPRFSASTFWGDAVGSGCTWLNVVPTIISYLLEGETPQRESLSGLRFCRSASAALPPEHHRAFESLFGIGVLETMGLTETVAPAFSNPLRAGDRKIGSVGRASGGEARVVDALLAPVTDGTTGELVVRGPHVMRGYYKNNEATRASMTPDGWLRTGDLGHRDSDGFFFVTGRIKELIIKGGENIAPREIDEVLLQHPAVLEAAAVGIPDRHYGQDIAACVVLRDGVSCEPDELHSFCVERLGRYKAPRLIRFVEALPRGPSGKVQRLKLLGEFDVVGIGTPSTQAARGALMSAEASLRLALPEDVEAVQACVVAAFSCYIERVGKPPGPMLLDFEAEIRAGHTWLVEAGAGVAGVLVQFETDEGFYIDTVAVLPGSQGTGVGKTLLQFAEQEALRRGYTSIYLCTNSKMTENQVFYPRIGYVERDRKTDAGYERIFYVKSLGTGEDRSLGPAA